MSLRRYVPVLALVLTAFFSSYGLVSARSRANNPVADPKAEVIEGNARFTVLTPELIRMEWSGDGHFIDRQSLVFVNRRLPVPHYEVSRSDGWLTIKTDRLLLKYKMDSGEFTKSNLFVSFELEGKTVVWRPGDRDTTNLFGTIRTLDGVKGSIRLAPGLLSRGGWTLVDDSHRPLFNDANWKWVINRPPGEKQDWYFFGYGHDYVKELGDYIKVAGRVPMPPRFAFGYWWSRYWAYTDEEFKNLVRQFSTYNVPIDVLVVDMDWHNTFDLRWGRQATDQAGEPKGWTGYTWNKILFPNPGEFLQWCHHKGLKVVLNLHPASGIQPWEKSYPAMARAMGIDPATKKYVPFDLLDKKFARNYFKLVLGPLEKEGVNFWWIDWQQWDTTTIKNLNPTWWLNYTFYTNMEREGKARPIILSRWGGLGDHRYQIGFSGDVITSWASLKFQPYFTSTAANVAFGYWSHDIGGHLPGTITPELYTRWVQWGAMSPILRTHTTRNANAERRIWAYPYQYASAMRKAFLLRYSLLPYIYTASRNTYDTGVSMIHPLYYDYPDMPDSYDFPDEYFYGKDLIVAPVTKPISSDTTLASERIWVPPGTWIDWYSGDRLTGPEIVTRHYALDEIPILVRSGAVIPMQSKDQRADIKNVDPLVLRIYPGHSGTTKIYADEGNSQGYRHGQYSWTTVDYRTSGDRTLVLTIHPTQGTYPGMKNARKYVFQFMNAPPPKSVTCEGREIPYRKDGVGWQYNGDKLETTINTSSFSIHRSVRLKVVFPMPYNSSLLNGVRGKIARLKEAMNILNHLWPADWSPDVLIKCAQTGDRLTLFPGTAQEQLDTLRTDLPTLRSAIETLHGSHETIQKALDHLCDVLPK